MNFVKYASPGDLGEVANQLLARLEHLGVTPNPSCELMRARKIVLALFGELNDTGGTVGGDFSERVHSILTVRQWAAMLSWGIGSELEDGLRDVAKTLTGGNPSMHTAGDPSKERNVAFEVYAGCLATRFATDPAFKEPDLIMDFAGRKIGVACKALYGDPSDLLRSARKQIARADCDAGIVLVQLTNRFPHEKLMWCINSDTQEYPVWEPDNALARFDQLAIEASVPLRQAADNSLGSEPKVLGIVAITESVCITNGTHGPTQITPLHVCQAIRSGGSVDQLNKIATAFGEALNLPRV